MEFLSNPLVISYLALAVAVLTAIRVFMPPESGAKQSAPASPAAAPAPVAAPSFAPATAPSEDEEAVVAAIVAALSLYVTGGFTVRSIRPAAGGANLWTMAARIENTSSI